MLLKLILENHKLKNEQLILNSRYGIAYIDCTEKITQLNRSVENNILRTIQFLTGMLFSQLGITQEVLNGTADEKTMLNYTNRVVVPNLSEYSWFYEYQVLN